MAIPRGYKRGSGGFLEPTGSVPSGRVSGPRRGDLLGFRDESGKVTYRDVTKLKGARKTLVAGLREDQARHDRVMAGIAKRETDTFERVNKALNASKESDPKDKLGNTVPSAQTQYLEQQLISIMGQASQRAKQVATPGAAGVTPDQQKTFREEGPTVRPMEPMDTQGRTALMQKMGQPLTPPEADLSQPPSVGETVEVARKDGSTVQVTVVALADENGMMKVRLQDGSEVGIPADQVARINVGDVSQIPGEPAPDPGGQRTRFQANERRQAILRDIGTGL